MNAKIIVTLLAVGIAAAVPGPSGDYEPLARGPPYSVHNDGYKGDYYAPKPYDYGYETKDEIGSRQNRRESSDGHGRVKGSYGYNDPWGVYRQVDYIADEYGFRAKVKTNEPGTANQDPAAVEMYSDARLHVPWPKAKYDVY